MGKVSETRLDKARADASFNANAEWRAERLPCKCGTRLPLKIVVRDMGRSKSYRAKCIGCQKMSAATFYADKITDRWNEVAAR